jgi:hypothetical protein
MRRWQYIATLSLLLLALPAWAQRGGHGGHFASGGGHFSGGQAAMGHASGAFRGGFGRGTSVRIRTGNPYYGRGFYRGWGYYPYGYYPWDYYAWDGYDNDNGDQDAYASYGAAPAYPPPYPENSGLRSDVQALNQKIDRLQADVEARNRPKEEEPATALVFRDQHVEEVHNYAIAGGTLWVLNEKAAKKIPLAQLDIPATIKMNDDRGIDFQVPGPSLSLQIVR